MNKTRLLILALICSIKIWKGEKASWSETAIKYFAELIKKGGLTVEAIRQIDHHTNADSHDFFSNKRYSIEVYDK